MRSLLLLLTLLAACDGPARVESSDEDSGETADGATAVDATPAEPWQAQGALPGVRARMDLGGGFFDRPFPMDAALEADGTLDLTGFPWEKITILEQHVVFMDQIRGASPVGGIYLPFDGPLDPATVPMDGWESLEPAAAAFLVNVDPDSPGYGDRMAATFDFKMDTEPLSAPNLLAALPVMGLRLDPGTTWALVVTDQVAALDGGDLGATEEIETIKWSWGRDVDWTGAPEALVRLAEASRPLGDWLTDPAPPDDAPPPPPLDAIRAFTVFTTGNPAAGMVALADRIQSEYADMEPKGWELTEVHDDFCLIEGTFPSPRWQRGVPPYLSESEGEGRIEWDADGPVMVTMDELRFSLTIPRAPMPAAGFPLMAFGHGMNGEYRQVIDRDEGSDTTVADVLALRGIATGGLDAVAHGTRTDQAEGSGGLNFFNFFNPWSVADNVRQTTADYMVYYRMASGLRVDPSFCPGADASASPDGKVGWDPDARFFMGHSLGSSIGGVLGAADPTVRVSILSGAGGQAISFVLSQKSPIDIKDMAEFMFGFNQATGQELDPHDPVLTLFQYIFDESDGPNFAPMVTRERNPDLPATHVLQLQGLGDSYTPEFTAASVATAFGLDLTEGMATTDTYQAMLDELVERIPFGGGAWATTPLSGNRVLPGGAPATAALRWYEVPGAPMINPHYGTFRMDGTKYQYACFLRTYLDDGIPTLLPPVESITAECE